MKVQWTGFQGPLARGIEHFIANKRALGRRFLNEEEHLRLFDRFLVQLEIRRVDEITGEVVERFLMSRPRGTARSFNHLLGLVRRLFDWLVGQDLLDYSPLNTRPRRETATRIPYLFDVSLAQRLLDLAGRQRNGPNAPLRGPTYRTIFALLYGLGLRVGEVSRLCCGDLDLERHLLVIRQTKFAKSRLVPFGPRMANMLRGYIQLRKQGCSGLLPEAPLFSFGRGRGVATATIRFTFHDLLRQLNVTVPPGVSSPRVHDLRHSFAVGTLLRWYRAGVPLQTRLLRLSTFLGHVDPASTAVYLTITEDLLQEANHRFQGFAGLVPFEEVLS